MYTSTLDPSLNGLTTRGKPIIDLVFLKLWVILSLLKLNFWNFGVKICFYKYFFEILSIAMEEAKTPEWHI